MSWMPPIKSSRRAQAKIWVLRRIFPNRWFVQLRRGGHVYILRQPWEDA